MPDYVVPFSARTGAVSYTKRENSANLPKTDRNVSDACLERNETTTNAAAAFTCTLFVAKSMT